MYSKIEDTKDFVVEESDKINVSLIAFKDKYENLFDVLDDKISVRRAGLSEKIDTRFMKVNDNMQQCDREIAREKEDRIKENEEFQKKLAAAIERTYVSNTRPGEVSRSRRGGEEKRR